MLLYGMIKELLIYVKIGHKNIMEIKIFIVK